jgi:hypothetical protein
VQVTMPGLSFALQQRGLVDQPCPLGTPVITALDQQRRLTRERSDAGCSGGIDDIVYAPATPGQFSDPRRCGRGHIPRRPHHGRAAMEPNADYVAGVCTVHRRWAKPPLASAAGDIHSARHQAASSRNPAALRRRGGKTLIGRSAVPH